MFADVNSYLKDLSNTGLTQAQYLLLFLLRTGDTENMKLYKEIFPAEDDSFVDGMSTQYLVNQGWLTKIGEGKMHTDYALTEKANELFLNPYVAVQELITTYPATRTSDGKVYPLCNISDNIISFGRKYIQMIGHNAGLHARILLALMEGRKRDYPFAKIEKFVNSLGWLKLFEFIDNNDDKKIASTSTMIDDDM